MINLGLGGMALETAPEVELERFLRVHVRLLPGAPPLDVDAFVRWRDKGPRRVRWGVAFVEPSVAALALVEAVLDRHLPREETSPPVDGSAATRPAQPSAEEQELEGLFESALRSLER